MGSGATADLGAAHLGQLPLGQGPPQRLERAAARAAVAAGLEVNAGHDLDLHNTPRLARDIPEILEASIGHALIADALYLGLGETVRRYVRACQGEQPDAPVTQ